nr:DNA-3-methyladenine glycosylase [Miltoncostaea marina]
MNLVCEEPGRGAAVLIRAIAPEIGLAAMRARRGVLDDRLLAAGPGRLCAALGVDAALDGASAVGPGSRVAVHARTAPVEVAAGPRIGISKAVERPWRFCLAGSPYLSRPLPRA